MSQTRSCIKTHACFTEDVKTHGWKAADVKLMTSALPLLRSKDSDLINGAGGMRALQWDTETELKPGSKGVTVLFMHPPSCDEILVYRLVPGRPRSRLWDPSEVPELRKVTSDFIDWLRANK